MEAILSLTVGQIVGWVAGIAAGLTVIVEFNKKIKFNPISLALKWIGDNINDSLKKDMKAMNEDIASLKKDLNGIRKEQDVIKADIDMREAINCRCRILRFCEEIRNGQEHSKESYDQAMEDIDQYEDYCDGHPDFKNNRTVHAKALIKKRYDQHLTNNDFIN